MSDLPPATDAVLRDLAPTGILRAAINLGNSVLAQTAPDGSPAGVTVDLATELARRLGVPLDMVPFDAAGKVFAALKDGRWDIAFLAIEPARAAEIEFTPPYVLIEGTYLVPQDSRFRTIEEVDAPGVRIATATGSAYDLYLSRTIKHATLVRESEGGSTLAMFSREKLDAAGGVRQPLVAFAKANPGFRVMDGRFMAIRQAMGTPKGRTAGVAYLSAFIEAMKASGFVAEGLRRSGQGEAQVAPAGP